MILKKKKYSFLGNFGQFSTCLSILICKGLHTEELEKVKSFKFGNILNFCIDIGFNNGRADLNSIKSSVNRNAFGGSWKSKEIKITHSIASPSFLNLLLFEKQIIQILFAPLLKRRF